MSDVTVREVVEYLKSITAHTAQTWRFVVRRDGSGEINSGGDVTDLKFHDLSTLKLYVRKHSRQSAEKRVIEAAVALVRVGDVSGNALRMRALNEDLCKAVDALESLGADHE